MLINSNCAVTSADARPACLQVGDLELQRTDLCLQVLLDLGGSVDMCLHLDGSVLLARHNLVLQFGGKLLGDTNSRLNLGKLTLALVNLGLQFGNNLVLSFKTRLSFRCYVLPCFDLIA